MKRFLIYFCFIFLPLFGQYTRPSDIDLKIWQKLQPCFLPLDHPIKPQLDQIFGQGRPTHDEKSMKKAGFENVHIRSYTKLTACFHPKLSGYMVKTFLDSVKKKQPDYYYWTKRIKGASDIRRYIEQHQIGHLFKVSRKWIYPLPNSEGYDKHFILIVEDMNILSDEASEKMWGSDVVSYELLEKLYHLVTELGFWDCTKPENIPFSVDGKVAFVDTENRFSQEIRYHKLTPLLSIRNQGFWKTLIKGQ